MTDRVPDAGAQNERTSLAWSRTGLALLAAAAVAGRFTAGPLGAAGVVVAAAAAVASVWVLVVARRRYRAAHAALHGRLALPDGRLPAMVSAVVVLLGVVELAYVALH